MSPVSQEAQLAVTAASSHFRNLEFDRLGLRAGSEAKFSPGQTRTLLGFDPLTTQSARHVILHNTVKSGASEEIASQLVRYISRADARR